jgi:hypothetical protein
MLRILLVCATVAIMSPLALAGEDFRCDTEVFVGKDKNPVQQTLTIFSGSVVYDFLISKPEEITVYDLGRGQITLLDKGRKLKTTIQNDDLLQFTAAYKTVKAESELFIFCTQPKFEETFKDNLLTLSARQLTYKVTGAKPDHAGAHVLYRQFADWSARLNGMRPGNLPPFPRLQLNENLAAKGLVPEEIERTISTMHLTGRRIEIVRSQHRFNWALNTQDHQRIDQVGDQLVDYKPTSVEDYLGLNQVKKTAMK